MNGRSSRVGVFGGLRPSGWAGVVWGGLLLWQGRQLFQTLQHRSPSDGEQDAIAILGVRHLGQGALQLVAPRHLGHLYAGIDGIHAASMVVMAATSEQRRKAVLLSGAIAALSGVMAAASTKRSQPGGTR